MRTWLGVPGAMLALACCACSNPYPDPPETRRVDVVDVLHGERVSDPYRWLEAQDSAETREWIELQRAYAETVVGQSGRRTRLRDRLEELMRRPEIGSPEKGGAFEYFMMRRADDELAVVYRRQAPPEGELERIDPRGDYEVVLDAHSMSADHTTRVELLSVSPDGALLLYSVRDGGEDEIEIRVRDVEKGTELPDVLPRALYGSVSFAKHGRGFYYTHRSREKGPRVRYHALGTPVEDDEELFGEGYEPTSFINASEIADGESLLLTVNHGWARSELHILQLNDDSPARALVSGADARFYPRFHEGVLYARTNLDAPRNRLIAIDLDRPERDAWRDVLRESDDVLADVAFIDGRIYATYLRDVASRISIYDLEGSPIGDVPVPEHHTASLRGAGPGKAFLELTSFAQPPVTYLLDVSSGERELWSPPADAELDASELAVEQVRYRSKDGTEVPMFLFHREGIERDGAIPTLLFGYGGFNVAQTPRFDPLALVWVEEGGLYAVANLRGGSEYGEAWHRAGMLENKQNVFDDFIAAAELLIDEGYTRSEKLAIRGVSNGGLLVASAVTQRPDLYRAALCGFPDLDMIRFYGFTETNNLPALLEYGDASQPEQFRFLRSYSPYQAVREGTAYPAVMLTSGDRDTRVPPLQARKMTAHLQWATSSGHPVILRYHPKAGHAASYGMPVSRSAEDAAMELEFLLSQLGVPSGS